MFEEVPEPVWKTSIGNWSSCSPAATASPAAAIRSARAGSRPPSSPLTSAAAALIRPSQRTTGIGTRSPETGKFSTAFVVSPPHNCSVNCDPPFEFAAPAYSAARFARVEAFAVGAQESGREGPAAGAVASGGVEASEQIGLDAIRAGGAARRCADQVAEADGGYSSRLRPGLGVEPRSGGHHRRPDGGEVAGLLVLDQAAADRRAALQLHRARHVLQCGEIRARASQAGDWRRIVRRAAADCAQTQEDDDNQGRAHAHQVLNVFHRELDADEAAWGQSPFAETPPEWTVEMPPAGPAGLFGARLGFFGWALPALLCAPTGKTSTHSASWNWGAGACSQERCR